MIHDDNNSYPRVLATPTIRMSQGARHVTLAYTTDLHYGYNVFKATPTNLGYINNDRQFLPDRFSLRASLSSLKLSSGKRGFATYEAETSPVLITSVNIWPMQTTP